MIRVGYLITLYNKEPFLESVLAGLQSQEGDFQKEYVFVDDGSTDQTLKKIQDLTKNIPNTKVFTQKNQGPSIAFNHGLSKITADFLKPLDGDDVLPPYATKLLLEGLNSHPTACVAYGDQGSTLKLTPKISQNPKWQLCENPLEKSYRRAQILSPSAWLAKTNLVKEMGGCDPRVFVQDYSLEIRLALHGAFAHTTDTVYLSPPEAPGRMSESVGQTLHDLNLALANLCQDNEIPPELRHKIWHRITSRAYRWARRYPAPFSVRIKALCHYLSSFLPKTPTAGDLFKACETFQQCMSIRLPTQEKAQHEKS